MAEIKLLPCPFCGADLRHDVELAACDTAGCFVCSIAVTKSVPKRVAAWNTRAAHTAQAAELERLREALAYIGSAHLPDEPAAYGTHPEAAAQHRDRHIMYLRHYARTALAGGRADG